MIWAEWALFILLAGFLWGFGQAAGRDASTWASRRFMDGCTHGGVAKGTTCPLCGRTV